MNHLSKQFDEFFARGFTGVCSDANRAIAKEAFMAGAGCAIHSIQDRIVPLRTLARELDSYIDVKIAEIRNPNHN